MSTSIIKVDGYVATEPELRRMPDGTSVLDLSVPHQRSQRIEGTNDWQGVGPTTWHSASLYGPEAEAYAPLVRKGTHVVVEGFAELRVYESNGKPGAEIIVRRARVGIIPKKPRQGEQRQAAPDAPPQPSPVAWAPPADYGDDTPF